MADGEDLLARVYNALYASPYWDKTVLIVTYDEHGGMYDHVTPPAAVPPGASCPDATDGYRFDTMGPRVPALLISRWTPAGTVFRPSGSTPFDHTTLIKTVQDYLLGASATSLTDRDAAAESLRPFVNLPASTPNDPGLAPT